MRNLRAIALVAGLSGLLPTPALAQALDVPVIEHADEDFDTCALGRVTGLKSDGDRFLAVRSGPGSDYTKLDELHNGEKVWLFDQKGKWIGVVYSVEEVSCSPVVKDRPVPHEGKKGWVHGNWIEILAG